MENEWIDSWYPEVIEETEHYVVIKQPDAVVTIRSFIYMGERLFSFGYRFIKGDAEVMVCEKVR